MNVGLSLGIFTLFIIILIFSLHKWTYKLINSYNFFFIVGLGVFVYFISFRYSLDLGYFLENSHKASEWDSNFRSAKLSKIFLLDMCPLVIVLMSLSLIFDKSRSIAKCLAPIGLLGGCVSVFGDIMWLDIDGFIKDFKITWWEYVFIGHDEFNRIYFMMHFLLIVVSLLVILHSKKYTRYSVYGTLLFYLVWFTYLNIMVNELKITANAAGIVQNDWINDGEFNKVTAITNIQFPDIAILSYFLILSIHALVFILRNLLIRNNIFKFKENEWWYSKNEKLYKFLNPLDEKINIILKNWKMKIIYPNSSQLKKA